MLPEFVLTPTPADPRTQPDPAALATDLERCCFRDPHLQRAYFREFQESERAPLGLSWNGALRFVLQSPEQLARLARALLRAFAGQEIELRVECGERKASVRTRNADLSQVMTVLQELLGMLPQP